MESIVGARDAGRRVVRYRFFERVWELLEDGVNLIVLEAPTGCGKTEAVSVPFMSYLLKGIPLWSSLMFALPTRSLAYSMRERLSSSLVSLRSRWITVTIDHGELCFRRPFLEGDVTVTTYDTLLYTFYGYRSFGHHLLLPIGKIATSLIVMDEAQLLQDTFWYAMSLLPAHVYSLLSFGAQVIVMTATMPPPLREELLEGIPKLNRKLRVCEVRALDAPLRGEIEVEFRRGSLPSDELGLKLLMDEVLGDSNAPTLIVLNKVSKAVEVYMNLKRLLEKGAIPTDLRIKLIHSRLRRGFRRNIEEFLEREGRRGAPLILVSTQVVEAGLDYDFSVLITELSPVDSLIQRVGRVARKPGKEGKAIIYLDFKASEGVYPREIVEKTEEAIEGDEEELSKAPSDIESSLYFMGEVYTKPLIEGLQSMVKRQIVEVRSLIKGFHRQLVGRLRSESLREHLLRLGMEIKCWLADDRHLRLILNGETVKVSAEEFKDNIVPLSVAETPGEPLDVPKALIHHVDGEKLIAVDEEIGKDEVYVKCSFIKPHPYGLKNWRMFLLNREYYEKMEDEELGVVKPWG